MKWVTFSLSPIQSRKLYYKDTLLNLVEIHLWWSFQPSRKGIT